MSMTPAKAPQGEREAKDEGEHAFPVSSIDGFTQYGMTLRDYFAGQVIVARIINLGLHFHQDENEREDCRMESAKAAYAVADAMLRARGG